MAHSTRFQLTKAEHVNCLQAAIESFLAARQMSQDTLADGICGMSQGNFSKVGHAQQGDFLAFIEKLPAEIRDDYYDRLEKLRQQIDPVIAACEQMVAMAFRLMAIASGQSLPLKAERMVRIERAAERRQEIA